MANDSLVLDILETLANTGSAGVSDLARRLDRPKSSTQRALKLLAERNWICDVGSTSPVWALTPKVVAVAASVARELGVSDAASDEMHSLRDLSGENVHLVIPDGSDIVLIERLESPQALRVVHAIGGRMPIYATATGKAILAFLPPDEVEAVLPEHLVALTAATIDDRETLMRELDQVRVSGYAVNGGEWRPDVAAVAAPIFDPRGRPIAAISVSGPSQRLDAERRAEFAPAVRQAASRISARMGQPQPVA